MNTNTQARESTGQ